MAASNKKSFLLHADVLLAKDSTAVAEAASLKFFYDIFKSTKAPAYFNYTLIDVFIEMGRDQRPLDESIEAVSIVVNLLHGTKPSLRHAILDKGAVSLFVHCIDTTTDDKMSEECLRGLHRAFVCCAECRKAVRGSPEAILSAAAYTMLRFIDDKKLLEIALAIVERLARTSVGVAMILEEPRVMKGVAAITATGIKRIVGTAFHVLNKMLFVSYSGVDDQLKDQLLMCDSFLLQMGECIFVEESRVKALEILTRISLGPPDHVDRLITGEAPIPHLMTMVRRTSMVIQDCTPAFEVLNNVLKSLLELPRPDMLTAFLGYGVISCIVKFGIQMRAHRMDFDEMKRMLQTVLTLHPEWWPVVKESDPNRRMNLLPLPMRQIPATDYVVIDEEATHI